MEGDAVEEDKGRRLKERKRGGTRLFLFFPSLLELIALFHVGPLNWGDQLTAWRREIWAWLWVVVFLASHTDKEWLLCCRAVERLIDGNLSYQLGCRCFTTHSAANDSSALHE